MDNQIQIVDQPSNVYQSATFQFKNKGQDKLFYKFTRQEYNDIQIAGLFYNPNFTTYHKAAELLNEFVQKHLDNTLGWQIVNQKHTLYHQSAVIIDMGHIYIIYSLPGTSQNRIDFVYQKFKNSEHVMFKQYKQDRMRM